MCNKDVIDKAKDKKHDFSNKDFDSMVLAYIKCFREKASKNDLVMYFSFYLTSDDTEKITIGIRQEVSGEFDKKEKKS